MILKRTKTSFQETYSARVLVAMFLALIRLSVDAPG